MANAKTPALAENNLPQIAGDLDDFAQFAGEGLENVTTSDMLVPRLVILQKLSPQLSKRDAAYIDGAEEGVICDVGTGELFPDGVLFLPVYYKKSWLEWAPRSTGKGLINIHDDAGILENTTRNDKKQPVTPAGNIISETAQFFGLNLSAGRRPCFIPMSSTQLKKARKWVTLATSEKLKRPDGSEFVAPLWYRSYALTSGAESNSEGEWMGWNIARSASINELDVGVDWRQIKEEAVKFRESLVSGEMRADTRDLHDQEPGAEGAM